MRFHHGFGGHHVDVVVGSVANEVPLNSFFGRRIIRFLDILRLGEIVLLRVVLVYHGPILQEAICYDKCQQNDGPCDYLTSRQSKSKRYFANNR